MLALGGKITISQVAQQLTDVVTVRVIKLESPANKGRVKCLRIFVEAHSTGEFKTEKQE